MRALLFSNLFPTSADPTRGVFTRQLAAELNRLGEIEVSVPLPWFPGNPLVARLFPAYAREFGSIGAHQQWDGVTAHYPRYALIPKLSERAHDQLMYFGVRASVARRHREQRFDVLNAHWLYPDGVAAMRIGADLKLPVVLTALGCDVNDDLNHPIKRPRILAAAHAAAALTTVSQPLADGLAAAGIPSHKITVIPNGVDTARFSPRDRTACRDALGLSERPTVVCVSRLSHEKGVDLLVAAARELVTKLPDAHVFIVGEGLMRADLVRQIAALGLGSVVRLVGGVAHDKVAEWMGAADVVCMPSRREGHPNAAMEALACGRPLVASRTGALTTLITAARGLTVAPGDARALGTALISALQRSWDNAAIAASMREDSWARAAAAYLRVYQQAAELTVPTGTRAALSS